VNTTYNARSICLCTIDNWGHLNISAIKFYRNLDFFIISPAFLEESYKEGIKTSNSLEWYSVNLVSLNISKEMKGIRSIIFLING
jgi:hypothetical protein